MASLQNQVKDVCRLADAVIKNPSTSITTTAGNIGVCSDVAGFAAVGEMGTGLVPPIVIGPVIAVAVWLAKIFFDKEKEQQEKERMLREVICKQQAVIQKLNEELAKSHQQNVKNRQEIENLKEMLRMLEETEEILKAA